jgi:hypothetical protein
MSARRPWPSIGTIGASLVRAYPMRPAPAASVQFACCLFPCLSA